MYVALTRARQLCSLFWGAFNAFEDSALARLLHRHPGRDPRAAGRDAPAIRGLRDDALAADLAALAAASDGGIAVEPSCRRPGGAIAPRWSTALRRCRRRRCPRSSSAGEWAASPASAPAAKALGARAEEEGRDRDEVAADLVAASGAAPGLQGFPRGRGPGTLVHRILERIDFGGSEAAQRALVARELTASRIGAEWVDPLTRALRDALDTPLLATDPALRLREVPRAQRLAEMEFAFPVARGAGRAPLSATALADVFTRHGASPELVAYAERLRRLPFRPLSGFLRGYIDGVFAHAGRWYVVDYKTNDLGPTAADYAPAALAAEMTRHDYVLQAHLYLVALHRYLTRRRPGYDYARDCGGALYLFLRGLSPARGPASGVVHLRPPPALIAALSEVLAG
ncbi:MAG: PD-(D/E)XK nuclease family protein [Candidatus Binatia bacterium]